MRILVLCLILLAAGFWYAHRNYNLDKAIQWSGENINSPYSERVDYLIGSFRYIAGDYENALKPFEQLLKNHKNSQYTAGSLFRVAMSCKKLNRRESAAENFRKFLERFPNHPKAELAKKNMELLR